MTATPVIVSFDPHENGLGSNPRARTRLYREGTCLLQGFPVTDISEHLAEPGSVVWRADVGRVDRRAVGIALPCL
jgi:hypothetical protein